MGTQRASSGTEHVRGVDLAWERLGSGPALVWGHGLSSSRADEDTGGLLDFTTLADVATVLRYDARGHGESGFTAEPAQYSWQEMAQDQLALSTSLGIDQAVIGGASLGAATALHVAVAAPERISALLLLIPPTAWETRAAQTEMYETMAQIVETKGVEPLIAGAAQMAPPDPFVGRTEWRDQRSKAMRSADPVRLAGVFRGATTADFPTREEVAGIDVPTLVLAWTGDAGHPVSTATELTDLLPQARLELASTWDQLQTWTTRAADFLNQLTP